MSTKEYRVVFDPAFMEKPLDEFSQEYATHAEAETALDAIANYTLFLHEVKLMTDHSNAGWVEELINGEWIEILADGSVND